MRADAVRAAPIRPSHGQHALGILIMVMALASACSASRIENGVFHSAKGYRVSLPPSGWTVQPGGDADLRLKREAPPGGMLADATCGGKEAGRTLPVLARHLTFGLARRVTVESGTRVLGGREAAHTVVRGTLDGTEVAVEAVVIRGAGCVHDFLYVAPAAHFDAGRPDFQAFVESFAGDAR